MATTRLAHLIAARRAFSPLSSDLSDVVVQSLGLVVFCWASVGLDSSGPLCLASLLWGRQRSRFRPPPAPFPRPGPPRW
jgi:hypothetical protein